MSIASRSCLKRGGTWARIRSEDGRRCQVPSASGGRRRARSRASLGKCKLRWRGRDSRRRACPLRRGPAPVPYRPHWRCADPPRQRQQAAAEPGHCRYSPLADVARRTPARSSTRVPFSGRQQLPEPAREVGSAPAAERPRRLLVSRPRRRRIAVASQGVRKPRGPDRTSERLPEGNMTVEGFHVPGRHLEKGCPGLPGGCRSLPRRIDSLTRRCGALYSR